MQREQFIYINSVGDKSYYKDRNMTILHREDGPALEIKGGKNYYYIDGKRHNFDGPAITCEHYPIKENYFLFGKEFTKEEFNWIKNEQLSIEEYQLLVHGAIIGGKKYTLIRQ